MTGGGKSDLAMRFAQDVMDADVIVYVIDPAQAWQKQSSVPQVMTVTDPNRVCVPKSSTIFDISLMTILEQQQFVEGFCKALFMLRAGSTHRPITWLVLEEAQLYLPQGSMRAKKFQETVRLMSVGRNFDVKFCLVTPFASQVDKYGIKLCGQRYFGYTTEKNDIEYIEGFLDDEAEKLKVLQPGQFMREARGETDLIYNEPFHADIQRTITSGPVMHGETLRVQGTVNWPIILWAIFLILLGAWTWR